MIILNRYVALLILIFIILVASSCTGTNRNDFIEGLKPTNSKYRIHLFYGEIGNNNIEMNSLNTFINSDNKITRIISEFQGHEANKETRRALKEEGINDLPIYLLVDFTGIQLKTPYLSEVQEYIKTEVIKD